MALLSPMGKGLTESATNDELQSAYIGNKDAATVFTPKPKALNSSPAMGLNTDTVLSNGAIAPAAQGMTPQTAVTPTLPVINNPDLQQPEGKQAADAVTVPDVSVVHGNNSRVRGLSAFSTEGENGGFAMQTKAGQAQLAANENAPYNSFQDATAAVLTKAPEKSGGLYMPSGGGTGVVPGQDANSYDLTQNIINRNAEALNNERYIAGINARTANTPENQMKALDDQIAMHMQTLASPSVLGNAFNGGEQIQAANNALRILTMQKAALATAMAGQQKNAADIQMHQITAEEGRKARVESAGLMAEAKKESAKDLATSRVDAAKATAQGRIDAAEQRRIERLGLIDHETLQARRDLGTRIRDLQRGYIGAVKSGNADQVNAMIDQIEGINEDAKSMGVVPLPVPKRMQTDTERAAIQDQAVSNLKQKQPWYKFGDPNPADIDSEVNRINTQSPAAKGLTTPGTPGTMQMMPSHTQSTAETSQKAVLSGNAVSINGNSYPLNPDGTVTVDGRRYHVQ